VPELDAFESLRVCRASVDEDGEEDGFAPTAGGTSVDEATIVVVAGVLRGFGAVVVPIVFEIEDDNSEGATVAELVTAERRPLPVLW
jgi:hypothetical protein